MAPETNATGRSYPVQEWTFARANELNVPSVAPTGAAAGAANATAAAANAAVVATAAARVATSRPTGPARQAATVAAMAAATEAANELEVAHDFAHMLSEEVEDEDAAAELEPEPELQALLRVDGLMGELQRARERALSLQQRFQTARAFSTLGSDRAVSLEDAEAAAAEASVEAADALFQEPPAREALWAAPTSRTQHARAAASALSPVETLEQRRLEEQHQLNLAMQYAQGFSGTERQEFFSLFFSRLREGAEGAFSEAAQSYTLILSGLTTGADDAGTGASAAWDNDVDDDDDDNDAIARGAAAYAAAGYFDEGAGSARTNRRFEQLRDVIYGEVATFIAANEDQPHFLYRVFQQLNGMTSDYLRQRTLYLLQELTLTTLDRSEAAETDRSRRYRVADRRRNGSDVDGDGDDDDLDFDDLAQLSASQRDVFVRRLLEKTPTPASPDVPVTYRGDYDETLSVGSASSHDTTEMLLTQMESDLETLREEERSADRSAAHVIAAGRARSNRRLRKGGPRRAPPKPPRGRGGGPGQGQARGHAQAALRLLEEASVASTGGGACTTDREDYDDAFFSQAAAASPTADSQPEQDSLLVSAFQSEIELNRQVLAAVDLALANAGPTSHMSPERISSLCDLVTATLQEEREANGAVDEDADSSLMAVVVRGVLEKYAGEAVADCGRRVVSDLENVLYDEMIFERIVTQVGWCVCVLGGACAHARCLLLSSKRSCPANAPDTCHNASPGGQELHGRDCRAAQDAERAKARGGCTHAPARPGHAQAAG